MDGWSTTRVLPAPRPRRTGRVVLIVLGTILGVCCIASTTTAIVNGVLSGGTEPGGSSPAGAAVQGEVQGEAAPGVPGLGQPVRDGQFEFVVHSVGCGRSTLDNGWLHAEAKGQFCVAELSVTNIGTDARNFGDGLQKATGPAGEHYAADTGAGVVANGNGEAIWNVVNPGITLAAKVVYDIPPGATLVTLELHDSAFSRGATVTVANG